MLMKEDNCNSFFAKVKLDQIIVMVFSVLASVLQFPCLLMSSLFFFLKPTNEFYK